MYNLSLFSIFMDISLTSTFLYILYFFFKGTYTETIIKGLFLSIIVYIISELTSLHTISWIFKRFFNNLPLVMAILFHQELRQFLSNLGRTNYKMNKSEEFSKNLSAALLSMSKNKTGALILVERYMKLNEFLHTGVVLKAHFHPLLIQTIFHNGTLLHDGAVIIRNEEIIAAQVLLPITFSGHSHGTRHSVGISITKERDCIGFIISEETGKISYTKNGVLTRIPPEKIREVIDEILA